VVDIAHTGQFIFEGAGRRDWLNRMLTNAREKLSVGMGQYTLLLNDRGGIIDDLIVYRIDEQKYLLVVNAARADQDFGWLQNHLKVGHASGSPQDESAVADLPDRKRDACATMLVSRSEDFGAVAVQGPHTMSLFRALFGVDIERPARK